MFVLVTEYRVGNGIMRSYFSRIATIQGQPAATSVMGTSRARVFKTEAAAAKFAAKWRGAGVGIERFAVRAL
jgi:poly-gamma-glutamate capsule biosynthesis protein CapA/YwtB (metallophosphatase superfamily)